MPIDAVNGNTYTTGTTATSQQEIDHMRDKADENSAKADKLNSTPAGKMGDKVGAPKPGDSYEHKADSLEKKADRAEAANATLSQGSQNDQQFSNTGNPDQIFGRYESGNFN